MIPRRPVTILLVLLFSVYLSGFEKETPSAPENCKVPAGDILTTGKWLYGEEELIIRDFFNDQRNGIFVDVGCGHYMNGSTTYYLEKYLGWSGIGIDALGEFKAEYEKERPNTRFFNYIVTDHSGTREPFYRLTTFTGGSSVFREYTEEKSTYDGGHVETLEVPTITLTELLDQSGITHIDFLSMDIEDSEPEALAGFDIRRYSPRFICIEAHVSVQDRISTYFDHHGYERIKKYDAHEKFHNWYFIPRTVGSSEKR